jgi:hypothetical protein
VAALVTACHQLLRCTQRCKNRGALPPHSADVGKAPSASAPPLLQWVSGNDQCGCQCSPTQGTINGYSQGAGCGTTPGAVCGSCNKCIDNQSCP